MKLPSIVLALSLLVAATAPAQQSDLYTIPAKSKYSLASFAGKKPLTRAERTNFLETSHYDDVMQFIDSLKLLGAKIATGSVAKTSQGREVPYVIASRPPVSTPAEARRLNRPIAYIEANIHSGEVEGKEAVLALLRDLLFDKKPNVLDSIVLIVIPDYNADGNENFGPQARNRGEQNGPELVGTRANANNLNLNRDFMKGEAPETRGTWAMFTAWNPDLYMDLHTTDGSIHGYSLTYSPSLDPASITVIPYEVNTMLPAIRQRMRDRDGFEVTDYGDFSQSRGAGGRGGAGRGGAPAGGAGAASVGATGSAAAARGGTAGAAGAAAGARGRGGGRGGGSLESMIADSIPTSGWAFSTYEPFPRYGTNYYGLRGRISVLSEAFSHDPFARRIASTYDFVSENLSYVAEHGKEIMNLGKQSDAKLAEWAAKPGSSPAIALQSRMDTTRIEDVRVEEVTPLTDPTKAEAGLGGNRHRTGIIKLVRMPVMASFKATLTTTLPYAYAFDAKVADSILPLLKLHGIQVEQLTASANVSAAGFTVDSVFHPRGASDLGPRVPSGVRGHWADAANRTLPVGTYVVPAGQPLGLLALYILEPESDDGLTFWDYVDPFLAAGKEYPVVRLATPAKLSSHPVRN